MYWAGPGIKLRLLTAANVISTKGCKGTGHRGAGGTGRGKKKVRRKPGWKGIFWHSITNVRTVAQGIAKVAGKAPSKVIVKNTINFPSSSRPWHGLNGHFRRNWVVRFKGHLQVRKTGRYYFQTTSDDGSLLFIGGQMVVNNDGLHGMRTRRGSKHLVAGRKYDTVLDFFQRGGGQGLIVKWKPPGSRTYSLLSGNSMFNEGIVDAQMLSLNAEEQKQEVLAEAAQAEAEVADMEASAVVGKATLGEESVLDVARGSEPVSLDSA